MTEFTYTEGTTSWRLICRSDGHYRLERADYYSNDLRIDFLSADSAYRALRRWKVPEADIVAAPGLSGYGAAGGD
jgi:hypothetical protein